MTTLPDHLTTAADELRARALELLPLVLDLAERYERIDSESDQLSWDLAYPGVDRDSLSDDANLGEPAADLLDTPEGESMSAKVMDAGAIIMVMAMRLQASQQSIPLPHHVTQLLGDAVPEYDRLYAENRQELAEMIAMGRSIEREAGG